MFHRILVPLDDDASEVKTPDIASATPSAQGGEKAQHAGRSVLLQVARTFAERMGAEVLLLHVDPKARPFSFAEHFTHYAADSEGLNNAAHALVEDGFGAKAISEIGDPVKVILHAAATRHPDVILMAPHHRHGLAALRQPSVTERVMAQAPTPVLVWPDTPSADAPHPATLLGTAAALVIVPLDGSPLAEHALPFAAELARDYATPLLLLRVTPMVVSLAHSAEALQMEREVMAEEGRAARRYLHDTRQRMEQETGLCVQSMMQTGDIVDEIVALAEAHPGSLVVMCSHGRTGMARTVLGSVSTAVMRRTSTPLLVIPARTLAINPPHVHATQHS
ncbi:MAG: universal stress protein [Ktedonobacterales bacterium]